jgi:cytoskeletal protein CcmA (bactofilin family)/predicted Zn-ribbon and HTH transcriptional regulator
MADEPRSHRIELVCPECGHTQHEPAMVVSTQCRSCLAGIQVNNGKSVARSKPVTRLAKPKEVADIQSVEAEHLASKPVVVFRSEPSVPPTRPFWRRLLIPEGPPREVTCFDCGHSYTAAAEAQSSQCPRCSGYISLRDYEIIEPWNRRIQTCGNVIIRKTGAVSNTTIQCHHLTAFGGISGSVVCSGDLTIRGSGKITGIVTCRKLHVERGVNVEFLHPVSAESAVIEGNVRGQISCTGSITLTGKSHLQGLVRAASLIIKPGAKHTGTIEMTAKPDVSSPKKSP